MSYVEGRSSGLVTFTGIALATAGGVEFFHLIFAGGEDYLNKTFDLAINVENKLQLVAVSIAAVGLGLSLATGRLLKEIIAISLGSLTFIGFTSGFLSFKPNHDLPDVTPSSAKVTQTDNQEALELIEKLKQDGWIIKSALTTEGEKWCNTGKNATGETLDSAAEKAAARRNCLTGYTWKKA